jgi:Xaa-Pro aminopeptidase
VTKDNALAPMDVAGRVGRLRERLEVDALLVTKLVNIRYLTGFTGSAGLLLVLPDDLLFVTDGRYRDQAAEQLAAAGVDAAIHNGLTMEAQAEIVRTAATGVVRLGLEAHSVTWAQQRAMADDWFPSVDELVPTENVVESLRIVKDAGEVARIEAAATIATTALVNVRDLLDQRPTEQEFGMAIDTEIRRLGAEGNSFDTIVGSGPNGAKPHHRAASSHRRIGEGELVVIDYGALVDGYCSDMTRTICTGAPNELQQRMIDVVMTAQQAGVGRVHAGVSGAEVDKVCRDVISEAGWGDSFSHGTGHGVGLEIHEDPRVSFASTATLATGHVVTVEPGVYLPEQGGVRIEDTLVVTPDGSRPLTHASKNWDLRSWPSPQTI